MQGRLLIQIASLAPALPRSERKVADVVLDRSHDVLRQTLAELAAASDVSQPTVLRFCRRLGCGGYQDFKVRLAQSVVTRSAYTDLEVRPGDPPGTYPLKVIDATMDALTNLRQALDVRAIEQATDLLARAHKIEFYGMGASAAVAFDAHHKFFRLMVPCVAYTDAHMQWMSASTLGPEDVVVAISHTGRNRELLESVRFARASGAAVIAITASHTPLAEHASLSLVVDIPEDTDVYTPMYSRLMHLVVIDVLAVGLALRGGPPTQDRLARMKAMLRTVRLPREREAWPT